MAAAFPDYALVEHQNLIGVLNRGEAVRHHERRAVLHQHIDGVLDEFFRFRIHR